MTGRQTLIQEARSQKWFNSIEFEDYEAIGREGPKFPYPNLSLYSAIDLLNDIDLTGMRCAEIGPGSGLISIGLKERGAEYVAAIDGRKVARQCELAIMLSGHDVDYLPIGIEGIKARGSLFNTFDLVFSAGLMYHLINPFMLVDCAKILLKSDGLFLLQSMITQRGEASHVGFNTRTNINNDWTTFSVPNPEAMRSMLSLGLFERLGECDVRQAPTFHSILARSVHDVSRLRDLSSFEASVFAKYRQNPDYPYGGYSFREYSIEKPKSDVQFKAELSEGVDVRHVDLDHQAAPPYPYLPKPRLQS
ncbi:MAG: DUF1698 domain-containing protein [Pseudomonadota bacterium]